MIRSYGFLATVRDPYGWMTLVRSLRVYYQDKDAGLLEETDEGYRFTYNPDWVAEGQDPVSLTLPVRTEPWEARTLFAFFDGLIPEGWMLELGLRNWKLDPRDRFGLLAAFCRDTIGAVGVEPYTSEASGNG